MSEAGQDTARDLNALAATFFNGPMVDVVVRTTESCGKAYLAWQEEVLRFTAARLQRDSELGQALANTRNWADAAKLQQEWATSAIRDYTNETTRLFEIAADAGSKITENSMPAGRRAGETMRSAGEAMRSATENMRSAAETASSAAEETRSEMRGTESTRQRGPRRTASTE